MTPPRDLFTIGYEGTTVPALIATLRDAGIARLVDVRALPLSRKPGFSKRTLAASLEQAGIAYTHLRPLGTPKPGRDAARRNDRATLARIYDAHLATPQAQHALAEAAHLAQASPVCLLCYEADPACCHRSLIAAALPNPAHHLVVGALPRTPPGAEPLDLPLGHGSRGMALPCPETAPGKRRSP